MDGPSLFYITEPIEKTEAALDLIWGVIGPVLSPSGSHLTMLAGSKVQCYIFRNKKMRITSDELCDNQN